MTANRIAEHLNSLKPWALARMADCAAPDTDRGREFLDLVRAVVIEEWDRLTEYESPDDNDSATEIADSAVPVYTGDLWATFVDLAAYREDLDEFGPIESMDQAARVALYLIAQRLVYALVDEGKRLAEDAEEGEE